MCSTIFGAHGGRVDFASIANILLFMRGPGKSLESVSKPMLSVWLARALDLPVATRGCNVRPWTLTCLLRLGGLVFFPAGTGHLARNPGARHAPRRSFRLRRSGALAGSSCKCQPTEGHLQAATALTQSCHQTLATAVTHSMLQAHSAAAPQSRSGFLAAASSSWRHNIPGSQTR